MCFNRLHTFHSLITHMPRSVFSISFYLFNFRLQFFSAWICAIFCRIYAILCSVQCVYSHNYPKVICFISHYFFSSIRTASLCFLSAHIVLRLMVFIYLKKKLWEYLSCAIKIFKFELIFSFIWIRIMRNRWLN